MAKKAARKPSKNILIDDNFQDLLKQEIGFDSLALLNAIVDEWGGPRAMAKDLRQDYDQARPGSMTRQRIIEMISRLTIQVTNQGQSNVRDASDLTDEELAQTARELLVMPTQQYDDPSQRPDA